MLLNNNEFDITDGLKNDIFKMIENAIKNNSIESFFAIDGFVVKILNLSISNKYYAHFETYIDISIFYYTLSTDYNRKNKDGYNKIIEVYSDRAARRIKESFIILDYFFEKSELKEKKIYNRFKLAGFTAFSQLLFEIIKRKDNRNFEFTLNQIEQVLLGKSHNMIDFAYRLNDIEQSDLNEINNEKEEIEGYRYFQHTILGIKYWLYFLYENEIINKKELSNYLTPISRIIQNKRISPEFFEIELLFNNLNSKNLDWYLNWQNWDFDTHPEGEAYFMHSPLDWIFKGVIIDAIQQNTFQNTLHVNCDRIEKQNPQNKSLLIHTLREKLNQVALNSIWKEYFNDNIDTKRIESQLIQMETLFEIQRAKKIVNGNLIPEKVKSFKDSLYKGWIESKFIRYVFELFDKKQLYTNDEKKLFIIGQNIFLDSGKNFFLEDNNVLGVDSIAKDYGRNVSFTENRLFFETVLKSKQEKIFDSVESGLNASIKNLSNSKKTPSVILIDSTQAHLHLIAKKNLKWSSIKTSELEDGRYDGIPVLFVRGNLLQNRFVVADFEKAFSMLFRMFSGEYDNELKIEITEVSNELAKEKLSKEPDKWKYINGEQLSDEDALDHIKTSIVINYEVIDFFEIEDIDAFEIGIIEK